MDMNTARQRAELSGKLTGVLDSRSLTRSHKRLAELLAEGMSVLDVGCGTGAITRGIAEAVGPGGRVVGIDSSPALIEKARSAHDGVPGLTFETGDIYQLAYDGEFDIVTCARVLIWLSEPLQALQRMVAASKPGGGSVVVADYNHEKIVWQPQPPASMLAFYDAYLKWRSDAGMDNAIADRLPELFRQCGLSDVAVTSQHEATRRGDPEFETRIGIWADTASSRGVQMARDRYIAEEAYRLVESEYREWCVREAGAMEMYMLAVEGVRRGE
jgi:SAM-dependent methyltransferase